MASKTKNVQFDANTQAEKIAEQFQTLQILNEEGPNCEPSSNARFK